MCMLSVVIIWHRVNCVCHLTGFPCCRSLSAFCCTCCCCCQPHKPIKHTVLNRLQPTMNLSYQSSRTAMGRCQYGRAAQTLALHAFSFANSERANRPTGRRNRHEEKKQEEELRSIAQGLCNFSGKQLQAVSHLLTNEHLSQIRIGMDIPPTNQGRRRQVGLVMGLLRTDMDDSTLNKLSVAVQQAARNLPYSDSDIEQQLDVWMDGLLANDQEVVSHVYGLLEDRQQEWQHLRTWVRQVQHYQQQQQQQQLLPPAAGQERLGQDVYGPLSGEVEAQGVNIAAAADLEAVQAILQREQQLGKGSKGSSSKNSAAAARKSVRRMLRPLALKQL